MTKDYTVMLLKDCLEKLKQLDDSSCWFDHPEEQMDGWFRGRASMSVGIARSAVAGALDYIKMHDQRVVKP